MIDPNNQNTIPNSDMNNQIDPNFLPKDSNVYIRTMNADLDNLKNQGGETLPYVASPVMPNDFSSLENKVPEVPKPEPVNPALMPQGSNWTAPVNNVFENVNIPPKPIENNPTTLDSIKEKINNLNTVPEKPVMPEVNNLSSNLNSDLNNLMMPQEFNPMNDVGNNKTANKSKSKIVILGITFVVLIIVVLFVFVIRPRMLSPKVSFKSTMNGQLLPATTVTSTTTTKPSPFIMLKSGFQLNNLEIDISKSPEIIKQIKDEANVLLSPNDFKVITAKVKNQFLSAGEVLNAFIDNVPTSLSNNLEGKYLVYSFYGEVHPALGLIFKINTSAVEQIKTDFLTWENNKNIIKNTLDLWLFSPKTPTSKVFKDREYLGAIIRNFDYPGKEASLTYGFFDNYVIITTSNESMNSAINYLQNGDTPIVR